MSKIQKERLINYYKEAMAKMMSDLDFKRNFGEDVPIIKYSELENYNNINDLLPKKGDFVIILTETKKNEGHWCCMMRGKDSFEWFDSYGEHPTGELNFIPIFVKKMLNQNSYQLIRLLKTIPKDMKLEYNSNKLQVLKDGINTCGRWCIARIHCFRMGYTLEDFLNKVIDKSDETGKPPDVLMCDWIK